MRHEKDNKYNVLILGASYGSLLATKILLAGHDVTLVCREATAAVFNSEGSIVRMPLRTGETIEICSGDLEGTLKACSPENVVLQQHHLVVLAMQEPQYSAPGVCQLVKQIASCKIPTMAITNMPLLPYLQRIPGLNVSGNDLRSCYSDAALWDEFDPSVFTQCSPDPQAFRPPDETPNVLQVRLPTNFKAARFASDQHTTILQVLERDIQAARYKEKEIPVKLRVHDSLFVPLAKWAMLMAGNYRCILSNDIISIEDAVCSDVDASRAVYEWVVNLCISLGGKIQDFVPFEKYCKAAESLKSPSSAARALKDGATNIERVDKVVQLIATQQGKQLDATDDIVANVDKWLLQNRSKT